MMEIIDHTTQMMSMREDENDANKAVPATPLIASIGIAIKSQYNNILARPKELSSTTASIVAYQCIATPEPPNTRTTGVATTTTTWM
mmetsp:Transcript_55089/g.61540  ORF Transcript_55089/g.61540 Transcript_55089/m.61540 type:complete len:87 (+) Transcript_55089:71-331(+)